MRAALKGGAPPDESGGFHRRGMPASESGRYNFLFVAEGFDGVEAGGAAGRVEAGDQTDCYREGDGA